MKKPNEIMRELKSISRGIDKVAEITGYVEFGDMSLLDIDRTDADDLFIYNEFNRIVDSLADIQGNIDYISLPVKYVSDLFRNMEGKYETEQGEYYPSGRLIEYLSNDENHHEYPFWRKSRVEHNGVDYYIVAEPTLSLQGLKVRVRGRN